MPSKWTPSERKRLEAALSRRRSKITTRRLARRFAREQEKNFPGRSKEDIFRQLNHTDASDEILRLREIRRADEVRAAKESPNENDWEVPHDFSAPRVIDKKFVCQPNGPSWACGRIVLDMFEKIRLAHSDAGGGSGSDSGVNPMSQTDLGRVYSHILNRTVTAIRSRFGAVATEKGEPSQAGPGIDIWRDFAASRLLDRLLIKRVLPFEKLVDGWLFVEKELDANGLKATPELVDVWIDFAVARETTCGSASLLLVGIVREWIKRTLSDYSPDSVDLMDMTGPYVLENESAPEVPDDCDLDAEARNSDSDWNPISEGSCMSSDDRVSDPPSPAPSASSACFAARADEYIGDQLDRAEQSQTVYEDMVDTTYPEPPELARRAIAEPEPEPERDLPNPEPSVTAKFKDFDERITSAHEKIGILDKAVTQQSAALDKANGAKLAKKSRIDRLDHAVFGSPDESAGLVDRVKGLEDELTAAKEDLTKHIASEHLAAGHLAAAVKQKVEEELLAREQTWFRKNVIKALKSLAQDADAMDLARGSDGIFS